MRKPVILGGTNFQQIADPSTPPDYPGLGIDLNQPSNRFVAHNPGNGYVNAGRPAWAVGNMRPSVDSFTIVLDIETSREGILFAFSRGAGDTTTQVMIFQVGTNLVANIGGTNTVLGPIVSHWAQYIISVNATTGKAFYNGTAYSNSISVGSYTGTDDLYLVGHPAFNNISDSCCVSVYSGYTSTGSLAGLTLLESFPLNEESGTTVTGVNGTIGTATNVTWKYYGSNVYLGRNVVEFDGTAFIDFGRPDWLQQLRPSVDSLTVRVVHKSNPDATQYIVGLRNAGGTTQLAVLVNTLPAVAGRVGTNFTSQVGIEADKWSESLVTADASEFITYNDGEEGGSQTVGSVISTDNLYVGAYGGGTLGFYKGEIQCVEFYSGKSVDGTLDGLTLLESFPLNQSSGTTVKGVNGTSGAATNVTWPLAWVPTS